MDQEYALWVTKAWAEANKTNIETLYEFLRRKFPEDRSKLLILEANTSRAMTPRERFR